MNKWTICDTFISVHFSTNIFYAPFSWSTWFEVSNNRFQLLNEAKIHFHVPFLCEKYLWFISLITIQLISENPITDETYASTKISRTQKGILEQIMYNYFVPT